jgi:hypothetical protein
MTIQVRFPGDKVIFRNIFMWRIMPFRQNTTLSIMWHAISTWTTNTAAPNKAMQGSRIHALALVVTHFPAP